MGIKSNPTIKIVRSTASRKLEDATPAGFKLYQRLIVDYLNGDENVLSRFTPEMISSPELVKTLEYAKENYPDTSSGTQVMPAIPTVARLEESFGLRKKYGFKNFYFVFGRYILEIQLERGQNMGLLVREKDYLNNKEIVGDYLFEDRWTDTTMRFFGPSSNYTADKCTFIEKNCQQYFLMGMVLLDQLTNPETAQQMLEMLKRKYNPKITDRNNF